MKKALKVVIIFVLVFFGMGSIVNVASSSEIQSTILYVKQGGTGNCTSWDVACELHTAVLIANSGDQVWVAAGTHKPDAGSSRGDAFPLESGVAIYGGFPAAGGDWLERDWEINQTILSGDIGTPGSNGDNSYHVVIADGVDETAILDGFIITGGNANGASYDSGGGGMFNTNLSRPTLTDVIFEENSAAGGGGMFNENSSPTLINVTFTGNSADTAGGMYNIENSSPKLKNVIFHGNTSSSFCGGMYNNSSSPTLTNVIFLGNATWLMGGGMVNANSSPKLTNVTFYGNTALMGAGMSNAESSSPTLKNVTFSANSAETGAGMFNMDFSSPLLTDVTFSGNTASDAGGGIYNLSSSPTFVNVTFSGNTAENEGGGMYNDESELILTNVTFSGNSAGSGGGMFNTGNSTSSLSYVTLTANKGSGIFNSITCGLHINHAIIWDNTPFQILALGSLTVTVNYSDIQGGYTGIGMGNINEDPLLGILADNGGFTQTHALGDGSPAIDAGNPEICIAADQRGYPRPIDGDGDGTAICDMGSFEYGSALKIYLPIIVK